MPKFTTCKTAYKKGFQDALKWIKENENKNLILLEINEDYQKTLLKEYRKEADFINKFYGLGDKDHFTAIELGHIYELMKEYKKEDT